MNNKAIKKIIKKGNNEKKLNNSKYNWNKNGKVKSKNKK